MDEPTQRVTVDDLLFITFPLEEAVELMESGTPYYLGTDTSVTNNYVPRQEEAIINHIDFYFNIVTVINFVASLANGILLSVCYKNRNYLLTSILTNIWQTLDESRSVQALILHEDETTNALTKTTVKMSVPEEQSSKFPTQWIFLLIFLSILVLFACYWLFVLIIIPLTKKSSVCRFLLPCGKSQNNYLTPATDILLDIVHIQSGEQIRVFLTTIAALPCSLSFTGSVQIRNFNITRKHLICFVKIDWHNCLLHYNDHITSLPSEGTAFFFQPNLLTNFHRSGPYNIQLLARHMDALLPIPHSSELDFVTASDLLNFPYTHTRNPTCPYQQVHDEVLNMMSLSDTPSVSEPNVVCLPAPGPTEQEEHFV